jgi:hypothetical protein
MDKDNIKHLYGEAKGIYESLEVGDKAYYYHGSTVDQYNQIVEEAASILGRNLNRYKVGPENIWLGGNRKNYIAQPVRSKVGSLVSMLEQEFELVKSSTNPVVMINQKQEQNQSVTVSVINISELVDSAHDEETKKILEDLRIALDKKDEKKSKTLLAKLADKSWELFIKILPYVLEKCGQK